MAEEKYTKHRRRGAIVYAPIAVLLIGIILIFGIGVFFRISVIEINGAKTYTTETILSASGINKGENLIFVDADKAEEEIVKNLPYLNEVVIEKIVPDKVIINVTESEPIAAIKVDGSWWIVDQKARALEEAEQQKIAGKIIISGIEPTSMVEGKEMIVDEEQETKLQYMIDILTALYKAGISDKVGSLDMSNIGNIRFAYTDRFTVILGGGDNPEYKLTLMNDVISQLNPDENGKIDLSRDGEPHFIPY